MKIKILGLTLILIGFALPFVLEVFLPNLFALPLSFWFFAIGFLLILRPLKNNRGLNLNPYLKWASYGIWANIILVTISAFYFNSHSVGVVYQGFVIDTMHNIRVMANPIGAIFEGLLPRLTLTLAGGVIITYWFPRELLTTISNLVFYAVIGIILKMCIDKRKQWTLDKASKR